MAKAQELRSEGAIPNILSKLVDKLKPKFERLYYLWNEVDEAKDDWNQCKWGVEEETEDAYDTFVKELAQQTGMKRSDVRDIWPFTLEMEGGWFGGIQTRMVTRISSSQDGTKVSFILKTS